MPMDMVSTSIDTRHDLPMSSFPRKRESRVFDFVSSMRRRVSPDGEFLFLLRQEKEPKEGDPDGPGRCATTLRCSVSEAAAQLVNTAGRLCSLGQCSPTAPQSPVLLGGPNGGPEKITAPHVGAWLNQKENEASLLLRLGPR